MGAYPFVRMRETMNGDDCHVKNTDYDNNTVLTLVNPCDSSDFAAH